MTTGLKIFIKHAPDMRKYIASLCVIILLSGCALSHPDHDNNLVQKKSAEQADWDKLEYMSVAQCGANPLPPEREGAVELSNCITVLVKKYVLPDAVFPALLLSSRTEALRIAESYAQGKISSAEYKRLSEERLKNYRSSLMYFINQQVASNIG